MKIFFFFLGGFAAVAAAILFVLHMIRRKLRRYTNGAVESLSGLLQQVQMDEDQPKSLSGADSIYLPRILEDFPDFNPTLAKTYVKKRLQEELKGHDALKIYQVVVSRYLRAQTEKTIVYQAALSYMEQSHTIQERYCLHYSNLVTRNKGTTVAANCPNCGAPVPQMGKKACEFCGSRLVNVLGNTWEFTEVYKA